MEHTRTFESMQERARSVRARYADLEQQRHGRSWTPEEVALGFVGDVGDLAKLVQGKAGVRDLGVGDLDAAVGHELADCLWSVLTLADCYGIDLAAAFDQTMTHLTTWLDETMGTPTATDGATASDGESARPLTPHPGRSDEVSPGGGQPDEVSRR